jgi:hypothetical protein
MTVKGIAEDLGIEENITSGKIIFFTLKSKTNQKPFLYSFGAFAIKSCEIELIRHVCVPACNNSRTASRSFMKFDTGEFY